MSLLDRLTEVRQQSVDTLLKCTDNVIKHLDGESRSAAISDLRKILLDYNSLDLQQQVSTQALTQATDNVNTENIEEIDEIYADNIKRNMTEVLPSSSQSDYMNEFNAKVANISARQQEMDMNDSDLITVNSDQQYIDPISKKRIVNPLKNQRCGHIYESETIKEMLRVKKKIKCPIAGCGDRTAIQLSDLQPDEDLRIRLTQQSATPADTNSSSISLNDSLDNDIKHER